MIARLRRWTLDLLRWLKRRPLKTTGSSEPVASPVEVFEPEGMTEVKEGLAETVKDALADAVKKGVSKALAQVHRTRRPANQMMRFKRTILDQLDDNLKIMGRMKTHFPQEYGLYSQIGAVVLNRNEAMAVSHWVNDLVSQPVSPWFLKVRPSFGAVVSGDPYSADKGKNHPLHPRLMHFLKMKSPRDIKKRLFERGHDPVQPIAPTSDLYIFTEYFDERDWARLFPKKTRKDWDLCRFFDHAFAVEVPMEITKDGRVRPLKIFREKHLRFGQDGILKRRWDYPYPKEYIKSYKNQLAQLSQQDFILWNIGLILHWYEAATYSIIQVRATKDGVCTLINVNVEETPDFFDDREDVIIDGIKKRIFHIVRPHERLISPNRATNVHLHFRGLREFVWNGYQIEISVPGRDHFLMTEVDIAAVDEKDLRAEGGHTVPEVASWLVANQKARFAAMVGKRGVEPLPMAQFKATRNPPPSPENTA
jgi:hypothetical protein